jgi:hypothetical protein
MANDIRGTKPTTASTTDMQADKQTRKDRKPDNADLKPYPDSEDALHNDQASQKGHNSRVDSSNDEDWDDTQGNLTEEELEGTRYQIADQDEDDIERAADRNTEFRDLRDTEILDEKTQMRASDKELAINGVEIDPKAFKKEGVLHIDKDIDSQEMNSMDTGLRDDGDSGEGTDGRESTNEFKDLSRYEVDDSGIDTTNELVNE